MIPQEFCIFGRKITEVTCSQEDMLNYQWLDGLTKFFCFIFRWNLGKTYNIVLGSGLGRVGNGYGSQRDVCWREADCDRPPHLGYARLGVGESVTVVKRRLGHGHCLYFVLFEVLTQYASSI